MFKRLPVKGLLTVASAATVLLCACQDVAFESNLNPQNFVEYAKPASVEEYTNDSILEHRFHSLGVVSGFACQETEDDFIARESEARTDARIKAAELGANGIVFGKCVRLEKTAACAVSVTCYGEAFKVDDSYKDETVEPVRAE